MMFEVGFGSSKREAEIGKLAAQDLSVGVVLAAAHFEWMVKRTILKVGVSPTKNLRERLEKVSSLRSGNKPDDLERVWHDEISSRRKKAALGTVLGQLTAIRNDAVKVRGRIIHGNGTVKSSDAQSAVDLFLGAGPKLRNFAKKHDEDLDTRLAMRLKERSIK
jgi:hypothetical protein